MVFIDANYFIRLILRDIPDQYKKAYQLIVSGGDGETKLFTSTIVFFEVYWVLNSFYKAPKKEIIQALSKILGMKFVAMSEKDILTKTMSVFEKTNLGLEDSYNLVYSKVEGAAEFATFDQKLAKKFADFNKPT